ncbi:alginate lyase [Azotobacter vinelandii CA]|uniref:Alginate lyase n=2 Tax=Azotobacter vinelandii TaxID=354 RepID=C1DNZ1_AZOVD|nr:polysaccharide lyase family 7 protein [Azotobacter vinelandii]ACO79344.1 alginate lyase [Azotobacter vinelandii DJ]AGK13249.1 alginate lyase [Azotobacter vinelandii CA]AGK17538.1 alginate lyase [Azotobacter vinelandii CA6]WKN20294.1 polysaccharide lyase family 7 protein [Azotobacter vinelandii]SFY10683.1 Alginate lyase [Azotobacter vinelandii]
MIDLSQWNLTIPVGAMIIQTRQLQTYESKWFVRNADGSITFYAPSSGAGIRSTANSIYPRSELRETLLNGADKEANWHLGSAKIHRLSATLTVDSLAASKKAIIGQFHGTSTKPPFKLQISGGTIYVQYRPQYNGEEKKDPIFEGYRLGNRLAYSATVTHDGELTVTVNGKVGKYRFDVASYRSDRWYAKAGMYSQEEIGGRGAGKATFHALSMTHSDGLGAAPGALWQAESGVGYR